MTNPIAVANAAIECKPKGAPQILNFVGNQTFSLDFTEAINSGLIDGIQGIYIDNSANLNPLFITVENSLQSIRFPPSSQGYVPLICSQFAKFSINSPGSASVGIIPYNFAGPAFIVPLAQQSFDSNGYLLVDNPMLDNAIIGNQISATGFARGNLDAVYPVFVGTSIFSASLNSASGTAAVTLIPASPTPGEGYFLKSIKLLLSDNATAAAAGNIAITISEGATVLAVLHPFVPGSPGGATGDDSLIELNDLNYIAHTAQSALTITLGTALTAGYLDCIATGGYTSTIAV